MTRLLTVTLAATLLVGCTKSAAPLALAPESPAGAAEPAFAAPEPAAGAQASAGDGEPFRFPGDLGGQKLAQLLPPTAPAPLRPDPSSGRIERTVVPAFERPAALPLTTTQGGLPRLPLGPAAPVRPRSLSEGPPLAHADRTSPTPDRPELPVGPLVSARAPDPNQPAALPAGSQPTPDRVPLEDPTREFSARQATASEPAPRTTPAPFARVNLPDPFENAEAVRLRSPLPASPELDLQAPPPPKAPEPSPKR
jgi:hypothetical protein